MPYLQAPGGSSDSVEVDSITVTAAITAGFGGGGGAGGGGQYGEWHAKREQPTGEPEFIDVAFKPTPQNCADARFLLGEATQKLNEYNALKNTFANEHVEFAGKLAAAVVGIAGMLGVGAGMIEVWNAAFAAAERARSAAAAAGGPVLAIGLAAVYAVIYIDRDRWDAVVNDAKADRDRLCGSGQT